MCISLYRTFSCNMKMMYHIQAHERWLYILINEQTRQQRINRTMVTSREMKGCGVRLEWRQRIVTNIRRLYVNFVIGKKEMMEQSFARNNIETSFYLWRAIQLILATWLIAKINIYTCHFGGLKYSTVLNFRNSRRKRKRRLLDTKLYIMQTRIQNW